MSDLYSTKICTLWLS